MRTETIGLLMIPVYANRVTHWDNLARKKLERERQERDAHWNSDAYIRELADDPGVHVGASFDAMCLG